MIGLNAHLVSDPLDLVESRPIEVDPIAGLIIRMVLGVGPHIFRIFRIFGEMGNSAEPLVAGGKEKQPWTIHRKLR